MEIPEILEIKSIVKENYKVKSFYFYKNIKAEPGQFLMVWIPRSDEKPLAVSFLNPLGITVEKVGLFTTQMFQMYEGDKLGIRGPYGHGFKLEGKKICLVSGGCGIIPISLLAEKAKEEGLEIISIVGAKTREDLFFVDRMKESCSRVVVTTDDGSLGMKGFASDALKDLLKKEKVDCVYTCGPEIMMKSVFDVCEDEEIECQASLERYMKCGFGLCGSCCLDDFLVCKDGPVFNSDQLRSLSEFGLFKRGKNGTKGFF
jgi:dihydroorotate dehydrogenase electron transfer subunit